MRNVLRRLHMLMVGLVVVGCGQAAQHSSTEGSGGTTGTAGSPGNGSSGAGSGGSAGTGTAGSSGAGGTATGSTASSTSSSTSSGTSSSSASSSSSSSGHSSSSSSASSSSSSASSSSSSSGHSSSSSSSSGSASSSSSSSGSTGAASYALGADISWVQQLEDGGAIFKDTDGTTKDILALLKGHGFNYIRLRTFVDPTAADGYSKQGYCDITHTVTFAKRIKAAGMRFLLDFHYSDNWADPGKQCIPVAWQGMNATQMAQAVHDYTMSDIQQLAAAGVTPDAIQVGNEITPGMLIHICDDTGTPTSTNAVNGSTSNWTNLASFLNAGIQGAHAVAPGIKIIIHTDRGGDAPTSITWVKNLLSHNVPFDVWGESCYVAYQGQPSAWQNTFDMLNTQFPYATDKFQLGIQEYGPDEQQANDIIFGYANDRGFGTFIWEPEKSGAWGPGLFTVSGNTYTATADMNLYDQMKVTYASRL